MAEKAVLIIDDDQSVRDTLCQVVEFFGYTTHRAANGKEALELLAQIDRPGLILLDLMMPVMNGWEFYQRVEESGEFNDIPIVVTSAFRETGDFEKKGVPFLKKPITLDSLKPYLDKFCG